MKASPLPVSLIFRIFSTYNSKQVWHFNNNSLDSWGQLANMTDAEQLQVLTTHQLLCSNLIASTSRQSETHT